MIKEEIRKREEETLRQTLTILTKAFGNYLLEELNDPLIIKDGFVGILLVTYSLNWGLSPNI